MMMMQQKQQTEAGSGSACHLCRVVQVSRCRCWVQTTSLLVLPGCVLSLYPPSTSMQPRHDEHSRARQRCSLPVARLARESCRCGLLHLAGLCSPCSACSSLCSCCVWCAWCREELLVVLQVIDAMPWTRILPDPGFYKNFNALSATDTWHGMHNSSHLHTHAHVNQITSHHACMAFATSLATAELPNFGNTIQDRIWQEIMKCKPLRTSATGRVTSLACILTEKDLHEGHRSICLKKRPQS